MARSQQTLAPEMAPRTAPDPAPPTPTPTPASAQPAPTPAPPSARPAREVRSIPFNVTKVIQALASMSPRRFAARSAEPQTVVGDPSEISQIIDMMAASASSHGEGPVTIAASYTDGRVRVHVANTDCRRSGCGPDRDRANAVLKPSSRPNGCYAIELPVPAI